MRFKINLFAAIGITIVACIITFQVTFLTLDAKYKNDKDASSSSSLTQKLEYIDELYRSMYIGEIDEDKLADGVMYGYVLGTGDKYANYFSKESYDELKADFSGDMQGIGVNVIYNPDYYAIEVINVMPDSPALEAGVLPGDLIVYVEGEDVAELGYYVAVDRMRGEAGTVANFTVLRGDHYEQKIDFSITRGYVTEQTVMYRHYALDDTIGIIQIASFDAKTPGQFYNAVETLRNEGATRLVIDIRYNPGGELNSIHDVLDYILPEGPIIRMVDKAGNWSELDSDKNELDMPMAVLINGSTASAGELFASSLKDYKKATLVGTVTYGKGTMQRIIDLPDGSGISISYQMYYPPFSDNYEGVGVQPDVTVELDESLKDKNIYKITDEEDNQLATAVAVLNGEINVNSNAGE